MFEEEGLSVVVGGLRIGVSGWQFPQSCDYWDGNWLEVTLECTAPGSRVTAAGPFVTTSELAQWRKDCQRIYDELKGKAELMPMEPNFQVLLEVKKNGHLVVDVEITPDHMSQRHWIQYEIDQSYLPHMVKQLDAILDRYYVRGKPQ